MPPEENQQNSPDQFTQIVERLKQANNVLVTVRNNPTVDQLSACIGLAVALNKAGKHATAVFSGDVPSTIGFLEPEKTLEKDTNSLRDFIISLDKAKADKLRYKVEDEVVKIFITPYKTSISDEDLDFSQGDFNVDAVIAIGVHDRGELDAAIVAHGRILHDATVMSVNVEPGSELGSINWLDSGSSSVSEMVSDIVTTYDKTLLDEQIATAFLTGIVAETDRFRNEKSNPHTMSVAGELMSAGASTQLVATKLEEPVTPPEEIPQVVEGEAQNDDGMIEIEHEPEDNIHIDEAGRLKQMADLLQQQEESSTPNTEDNDLQEEKLEDKVSAQEPESQDAPSSTMSLEPPAFGGQLTANSVPEHQQYTNSTDPMSADRLGSSNSFTPPVTHNTKGRDLTPTKPDPQENPDQETASPEQTLSDIEKSLNSAHVNEAQQEDSPPEPPSQPDVQQKLINETEVPPPVEADYARDAVERAVNASVDYSPEPIASLGAQDLSDNLNGRGLKFEENNNSDDSSEQNPPPPVPPPLPPQ